MKLPLSLLACSVIAVSLGFSPYAQSEIGRGLVTDGRIQLKTHVAESTLQRPIQEETVRELLTKMNNRYGMDLFSVNLLGLVPDNELRAFLKRLPSMDRFREIAGNNAIFLGRSFKDNGHWGPSIDVNATEEEIIDYLIKYFKELAPLHTTMNTKYGMTLLIELDHDRKPVPDRELRAFLKRLPSMDRFRKVAGDKRIILGRSFTDKGVSGPTIDVNATEQELIDYINKYFEEPVKYLFIKMNNKYGLSLSSDILFERELLPDKEMRGFLIKIPSMTQFRKIAGDNRIHLGRSFEDNGVWGPSINVNATEQEIIDYLNKYFFEKKRLDKDRVAFENKIGFKKHVLLKGLVLKGRTTEEKRASLQELKGFSPDVHAAMKGRRIKLDSQFGFESRKILIDTSASADQIVRHLKLIGGQLDSIEDDRQALIKSLELDDSLYFQADTLTEKRRHIELLKLLSKETHAAMKGTNLSVGRNFGPRHHGIIEIDVTAPEADIRAHIEKHRK